MAISKSNDLIKLVYGTQTDYERSDSSQDGTMLFFITDTHRIYKGGNLIANYIDASLIEDMSSKLETLIDDVSTIKHRWVLTQE